jgi:hypothetical protein
MLFCSECTVFVLCTLLRAADEVLSVLTEDTIPNPLKATWNRNFKEQAYFISCITCWEKTIFLRSL